MFPLNVIDLFIAWTPLAVYVLIAFALLVGVLGFLLFSFRAKLATWFAARWIENSSAHARTVAITTTAMAIGSRLGISGIDPVSLNLVLSVWAVALWMFVRPSGASLVALPAGAAQCLVVGALALGLSGCAQYIQDSETVAQMGVTNQQRIDDDLAKGISIAPQAIPSGALARFPAGPQRCALATLAGLELAGCTAATAQDVQNIIQQQLSVHFGPAVAPTASTAPVPTPSSSAAPISSSKNTAQAQASTNALAAKIAALMQQH